ncbi:hypothetical protein [Quadrisphaera sp. INWT6]|uniref:hypothetical protein n=1 Tax=Quadrisphaera sp. INWT6 TaxID=2596917 RepID=UPI00189273B6|nr:hypothetical protein [Quadrisphaera sp. INWT6]MBF5082653.1 hypothetical protein [Quadrisphaera sp. INWT6]
MTDRTAVTGDRGPEDGYAAWRGVYGTTLGDQVRGTGRRSRARRVWIAVLAGVVVVVLVGTGVSAVVALVRWDLLELLDTLTSPGTVILLLLAAWTRWPPQTRVTPDALVVRSAPWRTRSVPWTEVVEVGPPGRYDEHPVARLASGERLALVGLPTEVASAMLEVTSPPRPTPAPGGAVTPLPEPAPDDDLDGPFRRGRTTR